MLFRWNAISFSICQSPQFFIFRWTSNSTDRLFSSSNVGEELFAHKSMYNFSFKYVRFILIFAYHLSLQTIFMYFLFDVCFLSAFSVLFKLFLFYALVLNSFVAYRRIHKRTRAVKWIPLKLTFWSPFSIKKLSSIFITKKLKFRRKKKIKCVAFRFWLASSMYVFKIRCVCCWRYFARKEIAREVIFFNFIPFLSDWLG